MGKAKPHPDQMGFDFSAPAPCKGVAELAGLERMISETVGTILNSDPRDRWVIAGEVSKLLDDDVSKGMLDAYAAPARPDHKVPASRMLAIAVVCDRQDLLRPLLRKIGIGALIGDEIKTARMGQLQKQIAEAQAEMRALKKDAPVIHEDGEEE